MAQLFANNVSTKLDTSIQSTDTSMTVWSSAGMPTLGVDDYFLLTLVGTTDGTETAWEIVKVTAVVGNTLTIVRAQEGTTAQFWAGGTKAEIRLTATPINSVMTQLDGLATALATINGV